MLLYNSRLRHFQGKIKTEFWGWFGVTHGLINGSIEVEGKEGLALKVNGKHLKLSFGEFQEISQITELYLEDSW